MKVENQFRLLLIVAGLLAILFIQRGCENKEPVIKKQEVIIPKKEGSFEKPTKVIEGKSKKDSVVWKDKIIRTENPVNKKMASELIEALKYKDSLKVLKLYLSAIEERDGTYVFDDKNLNLEVATRTRGTLLSIKPKYTIKEQRIEVPVKQKQQVFAMYAGFGISDNIQLNNFAVQAEVGFQNKKGDIISAGYDTQKNISIKYSKQLFKIEK